ncbi:MAG TPA: hypothetical protein DDZ89_16320 [Clostridiales bacterium]|nr:hypothetical protein [Clostridiales bacterium]
MEPYNKKEAVHNKTILTSRKGHAHAVMIPVDDVVEVLKEKFIAFDVETTGLNPVTDRIVEIGTVLFMDGKPVDSFCTLVNPKQRISQAASAVNQITNDMLKTAPLEEDVYPSLANFFDEAMDGNTILCAHNAKFDFGFLCNTFSRLGYDANIRYVDTLSLSRKYVKELWNYRLNTVAKSFGLINSNAHRADSDAEICGTILCKLLDLIDGTKKDQRRSPATRKVSRLD